MKYMIIYLNNKIIYQSYYITSHLNDTCPMESVPYMPMPYVNLAKKKKLYVKKGAIIL